MRNTTDRCGGREREQRCGGDHEKKVLKWALLLRQGQCLRVSVSLFPIVCVCVCVCACACACVCVHVRVKINPSATRKHNTSFVKGLMRSITALFSILQVSSCVIKLISRLSLLRRSAYVVFGTLVCCFAPPGCFYSLCCKILLNKLHHILTIMASLLLHMIQAVCVPFSVY